MKLQCGWKSLAPGVKCQVATLVPLPQVYKYMEYNIMVACYCSVECMIMIPEVATCIYRMHEFGVKGTIRWLTRNCALTN